MCVCREYYPTALDEKTVGLLVVDTGESDACVLMLDILRSLTSRIGSVSALKFTRRQNVLARKADRRVRAI